jgi:surfactin synthase thioesterase subunit
MPGPRRLYVASNPAPIVNNGAGDWDGAAESVYGYLRDMGGTPAEVFEDADLVAGLVRTLRADLTVLTTYAFRSADPLDVSIRAFAGTEDVVASAERMAGWRAETRVRFDLDLVPGGHFFDASGERQVTQTIARDLT